MAEADPVVLSPAIPCRASWRFDDAVGRVAEQACPLEIETVRLDRAHGRILAEPVRARIDSPRVDVAAMDGYAVCDDDVRAGSRFAICGNAFPGEAPQAALAAGQAVRIFTGAPLPYGCDRVVVQELADRHGDRMVVRSHPGLKRHVRRRGSDFAAGEILLEPGCALGPRALVVAAAADLARVAVWRRPRVHVMSTGDEIASPGLASLSGFDSPDSLSNAVLAMAELWGGERAGSSIVPDKAELVEAQARFALSRADVLIITGGASVGERDLSRTALVSLGLDMMFERVAIKPGKPLWYGRIGDTHILGLPGNPTAALVTARLILGPLLCGLTARPITTALRWRFAPLDAPIAAIGDRESFLCADYDGLTVRVLDRQAASSQLQLASANALVRRMPCAPSARAGEPVMILDF